MQELRREGSTLERSHPSPWGEGIAADPEMQHLGGQHRLRARAARLGDLQAVCSRVAVAGRHVPIAGRDEPVSDQEHRFAPQRQGARRERHQAPGQYVSAPHVCEAQAAFPEAHASLDRCRHLAKAGDARDVGLPRAHDLRRVAGAGGSGFRRFSASEKVHQAHVTPSTD